MRGEIEFVTALVLVVFAGAARADHEDGLRPESDSRSMRCESLIESATIRFKAPGYFTTANYEVGLRFEPVESEFWIDWNYGADTELQFIANEENPRIGTPGKLHYCIERPNFCRQMTEKAMEALRLARDRAQSATRTEREALNCAFRKLNVFQARMKRAIAQHESDRPTRRSSDDRNKNGFGLHLTPSGPQYGFKLGPTVYTPDGKSHLGF